MPYAFRRFGRALLSSSLLLGAMMAPAPAQQVVLGGGVSGGSLPRAMAPLCKSARRLNGGGLSANTALVAGRIRLSANLDLLTTFGTVSVADCLPGTGVSVDSAFAASDHTATALSGAAWLPLSNRLDLGLETGWLVNNSAWFIGPALAGQRGHLRAEIIGRVHLSSFDEVTRDFDSSPVRELARRERTEPSWGVAARILLLTRGR